MVDLVAVSFVDASGKLLLKKLASRNTEFSTHGNPLMISLVNDIGGEQQRGRLPTETPYLQRTSGR
jgi:sensor domain CHASE-containing protein